MYKLLQIIKSFRYLLLLFLLEIISLKSFFGFQKTNNAIFLESITNIKCYINKQFKTLSEYIYLKEINENLIKENISLKNKLINTYSQIPPSLKNYTDTIIGPNNNLFIKQYHLYEAKVLSINSIYNNNYFHIFRGSDQGVKKNMAVFSPNGIAGVVINTTKNFATVLSVLNTSSKVSAKIKHTNFNGYAEWDGKANDELIIRNFPINYTVNIGDSVITNQYSDTYIPNSYIGKVINIELEPSKNTYLIRVKLGIDINNLDVVYLVENKFKDEYEYLKTELQNLNLEDEK